MNKNLLLIIVTLATLALSNIAFGADKPASPMPDETPEFIAQGHEVYIRRCSFCHGLLGDGNGPASDYLDPRPRDFTMGTYKFRTSQSGELPTNEDLFRTVSRGLPSTGMQAFDDQVIKNGLSEIDRWAVIAYIKTFAPEFENPDYDPKLNDLIVFLPENQAPYNAESIKKGAEIFQKAKCWECHGKQGRGDGLKAFDKTDDWGFPIRIRNLTHPWKIKAGTRVEDIYMRFSTGINGTPMPSFISALSEEERWYLANYIKSIQHEMTSHDVLKIELIDGAIPEQADDQLWANAAPMDIRLTGQVIAAPRWQNPSVELVTLKALYNENEIGILVQWDDPFKDEKHVTENEFNAKDIAKVGAYNSYIKADKMIPRQLDNFSDALALQFPVKPVDGTKKPHFFRGSASNPVQLWMWKAASGSKEAIARGWKNSPKNQDDEKQSISSVASWSKGQWSLIITRPLVTDDRNDVQFTPGKFIPIALNAWDGSNGEHGLIMSLSTWYYLIIEAPTPLSVYLYALLTVLLTGGFGFWLKKKVQSG